MLILIFIIFIFGTAVGSFLNCVIYRLKTGESFLKGRSHCPSCGHQLSAIDLIPVLSFVLLRGKCRWCGRRISWQYPIVEILVGLVFVWIYLWVSTFSGSLITLLYLWIIFSILTIIFVYDLRYSLVPDLAVYLLAGIALLYKIAAALGLFAGWIKVISTQDLLLSIISGIIAAGFFFILWLVSSGTWMGLGDCEIALFMGIFLGFPQILVGLFISFVVGAIVGLVLVALGKKNLGSEIPFGPFLLFGSFMAFFWGNSLLSWYLNLL